ncbi:MAG: tRNA pseudouridine(38-40) synthase TruA [candidate division WOR-3 bacterium]
MRNLKMVIEYDGTNFFGWQYQSDRRTVQGEIECALKKITGEEIRLIGAGRTDHGVHAIGQVANFKTNTSFPIENLKKALNSLINEDIYIKEITEVPPEFHARFSARSKIYQYKITTRYSPLKRNYYWFVDYVLNLKQMQMAGQYLIGEHDFKNLSVADGDNYIEKNGKNTVCTVCNLSLTESNIDIIISIEADRFLRKMVRGIVGFLIDVGRGRFQPDAVKKIFAEGLNGLYFAPAHGLYLVEVKY